MDNLEPFIRGNQVLVAVETGTKKAAKKTSKKRPSRSAKRATAKANKKNAVKRSKKKAAKGSKRKPRRREGGDWVAEIQGRLRALREETGK
jgi:hypothetical protein